MGWREYDSGMGTVTRAWDEWRYADQDQRIWTAQTLAWATARYDEEWARIAREPQHPGGLDPIDLLTQRLGDLLPHEHEWMTLAATVRDAVSAYEIYLMKAFDEVLTSHGKTRRNSQRTPRWTELVKFSRNLGVEVNPSPIQEILDLRNILTHQRGELRMARDQDQFGDGQTLAVLKHEDVVKYLDRFGERTRAVDPLAWAYSWGGLRIPLLNG